MLLGVGAGRNSPRQIDFSGSSKEIVLCSLEKGLLARSTRRRSLLEMHQKGSDNGCDNDALSVSVGPSAIEHIRPAADANILRNAGRLLFVAILAAAQSVYAANQTNQQTTTPRSPAELSSSIQTESKRNALDNIWSHATLYQNPDNPFVQRFSLSGRAQGDYAYFDADQGDYDDTRCRRFRFGFISEVLNHGVARLEADFDFNENIESSYKRLTDAHIDWSLNPNWRITVLKQSAGFTLDGATSSKRLSTPERNALTHNLWFTSEYFTGIDIKGACGEDWSCRAGVFSSAGSKQISDFDASYFSLLSVGRELGNLLGQDKLNLRVDYVHNDQDDEADTRPFNDVVSLVADWKHGRWGMSTDFSAGLGWEEQSDVFGIVVMPVYDQTAKLQWVARYTYLYSGDDNGLRLNRYERDVVSGRGDEYNEVFIGLNWFFYGHKFKWQNGWQYSRMSDAADDGGKYDGWGFTSGLRVSW
jgi:phosphate-selective porin OprO/OprP